MKPIVATALCSLALLASLTGCSSSGAPVDSSGYSSQGAFKPGAGTSIAPGRTSKRGGTVELVGTLRKDASGKWTVVAATPDQADGAQVIGVIVSVSTKSGAPLDGLQNSYVRVTASPADGIATDKGNLDVIASSVTTLTAK
jgi:hypothetical protein